MELPYIHKGEDLPDMDQVIQDSWNTIRMENAHNTEAFLLENICIFSLMHYNISNHKPNLGNDTLKKSKTRKSKHITKEFLSEIKP